MKLACCLQRALLSATRVPPLPAWHSRASSHSSDGNNKNISHLFMPVNVEVNKEDVNVGEEIAGPLVKAEVLRVLNAFYTDTQMREVALEHGLDGGWFSWWVVLMVGGSHGGWYPEARAMNRKLIFHAGPTNSGKTYHAMEAFLQAESGVYCGPLKLLAAEVFSRSNEKVWFAVGVTRRFGLQLEGLVELEGLV
ncbi:hypothetical protein HAZT_HAZT010433 [Hyalella azteca]|uniref:Uncharacterized protein n=1 Tax=Hyalella azteca TaxID=294128 RepID=A0A6A0H2G4_HYAAZ|nr:hypothetical protein HAZT_HAZT010433 [Hyalella azteca]